MAKAKRNSDIFTVIKQAVNEVFEEKEVVTRADLKYLPSKEEFFEKMDKVMDELKTIREEQTIQSHHLSDHSDRIEALEKLHPQGKQSPATA